MKKVQPVKHYREHERYPSTLHRNHGSPPSTISPPAPEAAPPTSRRAFLGQALQGVVASLGTLAGGHVLLRSSEAQAKTEKPKKYRLSLRIHPVYAFRPCGYLVGHVIARTTDKRFASFATDKKNKKAISAALVAVLKKHSCRDLKDGKRLARLERRLGKALAALYKKKKKRRTPRPEVTLNAYKKKRRPPPPGVPPNPFR